MDVSVLAIGRLKAGPESELFGRYLERARKCGKVLGFRSFEVTELPESRAVRVGDRITAEAAAIFSALPRNARAVCLDAGGELLDSGAFASLLRREAVSAAGPVSFVVGGPDGLGAEVLQAAALRISFGRVTWPHQLARILLAEQLYRAMTILSGHPYHRA